MTAEEHNKTLATLHFVYGAMHALPLLGLLLLVVVVEVATPAGNVISGSWLVVGVVAFVVLLFVVGLMPLMVGYGLMKRKPWAKPSALVLAIISLINIPIGTALGIYSFRFLGSEGGIKLYGGKASATGEPELQAAVRGAQPLMNWADRLK